MSTGNDWNSHPHSQYSTNDRPSIDVLAICRHRKWTILFFTAVACGLGYFYFTKAVPVYETSAQVLIIKRRGETQSPISLMQGELGYEDSMTTHAQVVKSPEIVRRAVNNPDFGIPQLETFKEIPLEHIHAVIMESLMTGRAGGRDAPDSQILQVNYRSTNGLDAKTVVKAVLKSYEDFLGETYQDINNETINLITEANDKLTKKLESENHKIQEYEKSVPVEVSAYKDGLTKAEIELKKAYDDLKALESDKLALTSLLSTVESAQQQGKSAEVLLQLVEKNSMWKDSRVQRDLASNQNEMFPLLLAHQEALAKYGPKHPKVLEIELKIKAVTEHMESLSVSSVDALQQEQLKPEQLLAKNIETLRLEIENADLRKEGVMASIEALKKEANHLRKFASELKALYENRDKTKELFDSVLEKFNQISLVRDHGGFETKTIWPADDVAQVEPKLLKCLAVGGLAGFLIGLGIAVLVDMTDKSFRNAEQVRQELGTPLLGHIPVIPELKRSRRNRQAVEGISESVMAFHKPRSTIAEAYRAVRTALNFGIRGEGHRVIQITSPDPGDGKSTFTANMAVCLAQSGKRVLLADADFRRPRVAKIFGVDSSLGLTGMIQGTTAAEDAVRPSGVPNLWLLPAGPRPENPSELLGSQKFRDLVESLRDDFDYVLIDTPPVLAVTDPCVVAPRVDAVVLLIRITKDVRPHARRTVESLQELGANIVGVVVNGVGGVRPGTGHVFGSQYGHRYAYESGYYDSNSYDYAAYHHYYTDEEGAESNGGYAKAAGGRGEK
ncbi:MAG: polysaccharide biosynthesis tyrosine autokinase [Pirellulales bacterium]